MTGGKPDKKAQIAGDSQKAEPCRTLTPNERSFIFMFCRFYAKISKRGCIFD